MYDPDQPSKLEVPKHIAGFNRKYGGEGLTSVIQPKSFDGPQLLSEKDRLRYYLLECAGIRERYGFDIVVPDPNEPKIRKLVIKDLKKLERVDATTKAILRELYLELK